jgi:hypothetical protein
LTTPLLSGTSVATINEWLTLSSGHGNAQSLPPTRLNSGEMPEMEMPIVDRECIRNALYIQCYVYDVRKLINNSG